MNKILFRHLLAILVILGSGITDPGRGYAQSSPSPGLVLPMDRTTYFTGEIVPLAFTGIQEGSEARLEAVNPDGRTPIYQGPAGIILVDTSRLAPGDYRLEVNGRPAMPRFTVTGILRRSAASIQDESEPSHGNVPAGDPKWDETVRTLEESGTSAIIHMAAVDSKRQRYLDALARAGALALLNPDTRPTSFCPTRNAPEELDSMSQRLILAAQANGRHPNFGGFCYGWDTTGFALNARKLLLVYWGWDRNEQGLRNYIQRIDREMVDVFRKRTGMEPVDEREYIRYLLSIRRPEFATMIDLPTRTWLKEIARHSTPMGERERIDFERRLDAWSSYLMSLYGEVYGVFSENLRAVSPSLRHTASVQVDHSAVRYGQYFPSAYAPLDFHYQSTWNDQVGGPDYAYQWLLTAGLLDMHRGDKPLWISNALAAAHDRAGYPGKFARVAAHGLAWGGTGIGYALEGFSNVLGGMNKNTHWPAIRSGSGGADVLSGRDFLERFAALALDGGGDHGAGILFSRSQFARQHVVMGYGQPHAQMFVALTRLGYTPRFVTEEELKAGPPARLRTLVIVGQTFPPDPSAIAAIERFAREGGQVLVDATTTVEFPAARRFEADLPFSQPGKPHNWSVPNIVAGDNDTLMYARWYASNAPKIAAALGTAGQGLFTPDRGPRSPVSLIQLRGGRDARYVVAINDSHVSTQADWFQVREKLIPSSDAKGFLYDLTDEKALGPLGAVECDLSATTVRLYGILPRRAASLDLSARQEARAGEEIVVSVRFLDETGRSLEAVIPVHVSLIRPDGKSYLEIYRATGKDGILAIILPVPANAPAGPWKVVARSQLDGTVARLPVTVAPGRGIRAWKHAGNVLVHGRAATELALRKGPRVVIPVFESPQAGTILPAAERARTVLSSRGVDAEVRQNPVVTEYALCYDPGEKTKAENARADRGECFGAIKRKTTNENDWFAALSGWRFGKPVVLLDVAGVKGDNPMAESLEAAGLLWPQVSPEFPGPGRAVVHGVHWAFAPRVNAIVIQATDGKGLLAGVETLANLPEDIISTSVESIRSRLWQERRVGPPAPRPSNDGLTRRGLETAIEPYPFRTRFPSVKPPTEEEALARSPRRPEPPVVPVPSSVDPVKQVTPFYRDDSGRLLESDTADILIPDMRFHDALRVIVDVKQVGRTKLVVKGVFRASDRLPKSQAQWEDVLAIYQKTVPRERRAMEIEVLSEGRPLGRLVPSRMERRKIPLETAPGFGAKDVRTTEEEVAVEISGDVELPAGRHPIFLVHRNIVDGLIEGIGIGTAPALQPEKKR